MKTLLIITLGVWLVCGWLAKQLCRRSSRSAAIDSASTYYGFGPIALLSELLVHCGCRFGKLGVLIITLLLCAYTVSAQTGTDSNTTWGTSTGTITFDRPTPSFAAITVHSDGKIICHACKDVPPDAVIGTLTDAARNEMFPPITIPPVPKSPFGAITLGDGTTRRYDHARQPLKKSDFFKPFGTATIISTSVCGVGQMADVASSTGYEGNGFLRGSDGRMNRAKAIPMKLGLCLAPLAFENHVSRKVRTALRITQIVGGLLGAYDAAKNWKVNR